MVSLIAKDAEARFARYMTERGYGFEYEPDLGIASRPEYKISAGPHTVVAEVKSFEGFGLFTDVVPGRNYTRSMAQAVKPLRNKIREAAGQLRDLRDSGLPLVVVLDNPAARPIPLGPMEVISAMYGDLAYQFPIDADGGSAGPLRAVFDRNGKLTNDHAYISAVAVMRRRDLTAEWSDVWFDEHRTEFDDGLAMITAWRKAAVDAPTGDVLYLEVFNTVSESAAPLPLDVFNGPNDIRWVANENRDGLTLLEWLA